MPRSPGSRVGLDTAAEATRTGDLWLFRGSSAADRAIRVSTNAPVNHVGMAVVLDDLPPLLWHAELGRSLTDVWSGRRQRGVQLHDLREAVLQWTGRYRQRAWLRQLQDPVGPEAEDAVLRTVARLDGTPFPGTAAMAARWLRGRLPEVPWPARASAGRPHGLDLMPRREVSDTVDGTERERPAAGGRLESRYCAEVVALTYTEMGLLPRRRPSWYDPGRFWSGDDLELLGGHRLGGEIAVDVPG